MEARKYLGLLTPVDEEEAGFYDAPQLRPTLEAAADLEPVCEDDDGLVLEGGEQLLANPLLLLGVVLPLRLVRLLPLGRRRRRHLKEEYSQLRSAQWIIGYDGSIRLYWIRFWPVPSYRSAYLVKFVG